MAESRLHELSARGQSVWIDYLSRDLVQTGELKRLMDEDAVKAYGEAWFGSSGTDWHRALRDITGLLRQFTADLRCGHGPEYAEGEFFGTEGLRACARDHFRETAPELHAALLAAQERFSEGGAVADDITVLVLEYAPPAV